METKISSGEIMARLAKIQSDMDYIKEHINDVTLSNEDINSIVNARKDLKEGKTRRL